MCIPSFTGRSGSRHNVIRKHRLQPSNKNFHFSKETTMSKLFFVNIPYNCTDRELQEFVESRGIPTRSIRIVRDLVAGVSPAFGYVELKDDTQIKEAISILSGKKMRTQTIVVKEAHYPYAGAA